MIQIPGQGKIFTTALKKSKTEAGLIVDPKQPYMEDQRVLAVGQDCPDYIKVDDIVRIDVKKYVRVKYNKDSIKADVNGNPVIDYELPIEEIDGQEVMLLHAFSDIKWSTPVNKAHKKTVDKSKSPIIDTGKIVDDKGRKLN